MRFPLIAVIAPHILDSVQAFNLLPPSLFLRQSSQIEKRVIASDIWVQEDVFAGDTFFPAFDFFDFPDPTSGSVNYVNSSVAFQNGLARVNENKQAIMQMDNTSFLPENGFRNSVRIQSKKRYNSGLFVLDLTHAPWGCSVWPAFWTVGDNWPNNGEIDVFEGVHDNTHNQMTWHTGENCNLTVSANFTGTASSHTSCFSYPADNSGCAIIDWSRASYGPQFDALGGGVFAMKWDEVSIAVWFFYRRSIPTDIIQNAPDPSGWGLPAAELLNTGCNIQSHFIAHQIVFDITTCGDWAGSSFGTSGCPGSCGATVQDPANFVNASWIINYLHVYKKTSVIGVTVNEAVPAMSFAATLLVTFVTAACWALF